MSADVQLIVVLVVVAAAAGLVLRSFARMVLGKKKAGCASGCGKCAEPKTESPSRFPLPQA
jgi:hypothetical protein